jgi:hypothetical protein
MDLAAKGMQVAIAAAKKIENLNGEKAMSFHELMATSAKPAVSRSAGILAGSSVRL